MRVYSEKAQIARECWPEEPMTDDFAFEACIVVRLRSAEVAKIGWCLAKMKVALNGWTESELLQQLLSEDVIAEQLDRLMHDITTLEAERKEAG